METRSEQRKRRTKWRIALSILSIIVVIGISSVLALSFLGGDKEPTRSVAESSPVHTDETVSQSEIEKPEEEAPEEEAVKPAEETTEEVAEETAPAEEVTEETTETVSAPPSDTLEKIETNIKDSVEAPRDTASIIADAQPKVFTLYATFNQGTGFLINDQGDLLTNAHVVEGGSYVRVVGYDGTEYDGTVIGYSNEIDVALVRVPDLAGQTPLSLARSEQAALGDSVIALGSPMGVANTATLGTISGVDRTFTIEPHVYENIYQISAELAPGSSGGPLLHQSMEKVIAINSAQDGNDSSIGFSIPLYQVVDLMDNWVANPMTVEEINELFYTDSGDYFYEELYKDDSGEFGDGEIIEENDQYFYDAELDLYFYYDPETDLYYYYDFETAQFFPYDDFNGGPAEDNEAASTTEDSGTEDSVETETPADEAPTDVPAEEEPATDEAA